MKRFLIFFLPLLLIGCAFPDENREIREAEQAAENFFESLAAGSYERAASLYAGNSKPLASMNPQVPSEDEETLLRLACEVNGFLCMPILRIMDSKKISPNEYAFKVEFDAGEEGAYARVPCCGLEPKDASQDTQFDVEVINRDGEFFVTSLPPYVP